MPPCVLSTVVQLVSHRTWRQKTDELPNRSEKRREKAEAHSLGSGLPGVPGSGREPASKLKWGAIEGGTGH